MLNPELLRRDPQKTRTALARRDEEAALAFDAAVAADTEWRELTAEVEALRAQRKQLSSEIRGKPSQEQLQRLKEPLERLKVLEKMLQDAETKRAEALSWVPNVPDPAVPLGNDDSDNELVRVWGEPRQFDFTPRPHWELGPELGILDLEAGARLADNLYHDAEDNLWLLPTSEVPLVNLYHGEIIPPGTLPLLLTSYTPCFRKEKVAAGKDVRGIKRLKQFDKVEMVRIVEPEHSMRHLEALVADAELAFQQLELPYQVMLLCTGDLGFAMAKTYDINVWAAGCGEWLECSSISNANDYQARRARIRFRREAGGNTEFPHTLNGSGVGLPRTMIAILENNQQADGSVVIPPALRPFMDGRDVIRRR
jgi:seryl-tRNA synthetase